jgi:hypothetical protein
MGFGLLTKNGISGTRRSALLNDIQGFWVEQRFSAVSQPIETSALQPAETVVVALVLGGAGLQPCDHRSHAQAALAAEANSMVALESSSAAHDPELLASSGSARLFLDPEPALSLSKGKR